MRKLILLRGIMGSGKSYFIKEHNLENYTISSDSIRLLYNAPELTIKYNEAIPQYNNKKVWNLLYTLLEERMKKGELCIVDAMHIFNDDLGQYKKLAEKYRYRLYIIDFSDVSLDILLKRNDTREECKRLDESIIKKHYQNIKKQKISSAFKIVKPDEFDNIFMNNARDVNEYRNIHVIGDIHACYNALISYFNENPFKDDDLYIFTGDYFDRGLDNVKMFDYLNNLVNNKNVILLTGNHEDKLYKYACDDDYKLDYDINSTIKEIASKISKSQIRAFYRNLSQLSYISFRDKKYLITHAGIPYVPKKALDYYSSNSFIYGSEKYEVDIDKIYSDFMVNEPNKIYQVHGHRNYYNIKYNEHEFSFNLDGKVEYGGDLRVLNLLDDGNITITKIKNEQYDDKLLEKEKVFNLVEDFRHNNYIIEKNLLGTLSSFNYTKDAFYYKVWDGITTKARGLFIDKDRFLVVARGYNKFFNIDERHETKYDYVIDNMVYPVNFYLKYNGFLGILSMYNDELLFATKSQIEGDFNNYFKNIFYELFNDDQVNKIKQRMITNNTSLVFEVVDHINDKHIIEYNENHLFLLDEIYNQIEYKKVDYDVLGKFAIANNMEYKQSIYIVNNKEEFINIYNEISSDDYKLNNTFVEGFVIEDSNGFMLKYKTKYYNFWKHNRKLMEDAFKNKKFECGNKENEVTKNFMNYLKDKYDGKDIDINSISIIEERNGFNNK